MPGYSSSFISLEQRHSHQAVWIIAIAVVAIHSLLLFLGAFWSMSPPKKETKRVAVTTITLNPKGGQVRTEPQSTKNPLPSPPLLKEEPLLAKAPPPAPVLPTPTEDSLPLAPLTTAKPSIAEASKPPPPPSSAPPKQEVKPTEKKAVQPAPKGVAPEPKKAASTKKTAPSTAKKQPGTLAKSSKEDAHKSSTAEAEKKRQKEAAAAKEAAEAKAIAAQQEAERVRLQEIAAAQEVARKKQQAFLAKAKENLNSMEESRNKMNTVSSIALESTSIPRQIESLQIDALPVGSRTPDPLNARETSYRDEIAKRLKLNLRLPDYGSVKIKLTLDRSGKVAQVIIIASESAKNRQYIEKTLPTLFFPGFGNQFEGSSQYTFLVTLNNED